MSIFSSIAERANRVDAMFADARQTVEVARVQLSAQVVVAAEVLADALDGGGKILICGNGGSASDSMHLSAELLNKFQRARRPLPAVSLTADVATLTAVANDETFDAVFAKQVEALGGDGDVLVVITSSGNSPNILRAVEAAHAKHMRCIALNGKGGGALSKALGARDIDIVAPGESTARVQEIHAILIHAFCELIDHQLFGEI